MQKNMYIFMCLALVVCTLQAISSSDLALFSGHTRYTVGRGSGIYTVYTHSCDYCGSLIYSPSQLAITLIRSRAIRICETYASARDYLGGSGGMPPQETFENETSIEWIWAIFWVLSRCANKIITNFTMNSHRVVLYAWRYTLGIRLAV